MIAKQDILDRAAEWRLRPDIVEKDYVLGWLLVALAGHSETGRSWVFKGGTCLKKCYFETYRFSEDLDFSLRADAIYDAGGLTAILREVAQAASDASGVTFFGDSLILRVRQNQLGHDTFEARLGYRGPLAMPVEAKVRLDLTRHEAIVLPAARRPVFHPYPDELPPGARVPCYALDELVAEKTRALVERTRPRDLYDVVLVVENHREELNLRQVREVFRQKCAAKALAAPSRAEVVAMARVSAELSSEWSNMLGHQLPALPALEVLLDRLDRCLIWLDVEPAPAPRMLASATLGRGAPPPLVSSRSSRYWGFGVPLDTIRFAGANRLLVAFTYDGKPRLVEPYSFRRPATGNLLLYGWEQGSTHIKAFNVDRLQDVRVMDSPFVPRYRVEFTA